MSAANEPTTASILDNNADNRRNTSRIEVRVYAAHIYDEGEPDEKLVLCERVRVPESPKDALLRALNAHGYICHKRGPHNCTVHASDEAPLKSVPHYRADGTFKHFCTQGYCPDLGACLAPLREAAMRHTDRVAPSIVHRYAERLRIEDAYTAGAAWQRERESKERAKLRAEILRRIDNCTRHEYEWRENKRADRDHALQAAEYHRGGKEAFLVVAEILKGGSTGKGGSEG